MNTLWLNIEVSPGSNIQNACRDAVELANKLGCTVWFDFNEVKCGARPGDNPEKLAEIQQSIQNNSKSVCRIAVANQ